MSESCAIKAVCVLRVTCCVGTGWAACCVSHGTGREPGQSTLFTRFVKAFSVIAKFSGFYGAAGLRLVALSRPRSNQSSQQVRASPSKSRQIRPGATRRYEAPSSREAPNTKLQSPSGTAPLRRQNVTKTGIIPAVNPINSALCGFAASQKSRRSHEQDNQTLETVHSCHRPPGSDSQ